LFGALKSLSAFKGYNRSSILSNDTANELPREIAQCMIFLWILSALHVDYINSRSLMIGKKVLRGRHMNIGYRSEQGFPRSSSQTLGT